jgi:hypothetical protein
MTRFIHWIRSIPKVYLLGALLIIAGLAIMIPRAIKLRDFSREANYAVTNHFMQGNPSPDLIRPWMTIRYVASAYAVPQKILYDAARIEPSPITSMAAINRINSQMDLGSVNGEPKLMQVLREAVIQYNRNPVTTGLMEGQVEGWMTVQYVANSTGMPPEKIFAGIGIPMDGKQYAVLDSLSDELKYPGGKKALFKAIESVLGIQKNKP